MILIDINSHSYDNSLNKPIIIKIHENFKAYVAGHLDDVVLYGTGSRL